MYNTGMNVEFIYSLKEEISRLTDLASEYQWFLDNNFPATFPKFYNRLYQDAKSHKCIFRQILSRELSKIYDKKKYASRVAEAQNNWSKVEREVLMIMQDLGLKVKDNYVCYVSLYGPEGQFCYPNIINLRLANQSDIRSANKTITHEILHLAIFNKAKKLKLDYKQTEGAVDMLFKETELKRIFPEYKLQNIAIHNKLLLRQIIR